MSTVDTPAAPPQCEPTLRAIAMPADANPHGDIFGGWLLSQMDLAGGTVATRRAKGRTATVAITAMTFHRPVFIGDEVTCYAQIIKIGTTSITVKVESWVRRGNGQEQIAVTEGHIHLCGGRRPTAGRARCRPKLDLFYRFDRPMRNQVVVSIVDELIRRVAVELPSGAGPR